MGRGEVSSRLMPGRPPWKMGIDRAPANPPKQKGRIEMRLARKLKEKPIHVVLFDRQRRKSRTITVWDCDLDELHDRIRKTVVNMVKERRKQSKGRKDGEIPSGPERSYRKAG